MQRSRSHEIIVEQNELYKFNEITTGIKLMIEWVCSPGIICDLDLNVLFFDERARFIEKLSYDRPISIDGSTKLEADIESTTRQSIHHEDVRINMNLVDKRTYAIVLLIDGGTRNFQYVQRINIHCSQENSDDANSLTKMAEGGFISVPLFNFSCRSRRDNTSIVSSILYKDGTHIDGSPIWYMKNIFEGLYSETSGEKDIFCHNYAVTFVPTFLKYRPHIFPSVKALCEALSSTSLPSLKTHFLEGGQKLGGLNIREFTEAIFKHLHLLYPKILEHEEAANTVAVIQEMFCQMNFNEDPIVDWEEFTTFCIQTDVAESFYQSQSHKLDTYVIEYSENKTRHDTSLSSFAPLSMMKYIPSEKRILTIQDSGNQVILFDDKFNRVSVINPTELTSSNTNEKIEKCKVYDCCYLPSKDCYAYCASDHTIVTCKEHSTGKKVYYTIINKIYSSSSHIKLCWGDKTKILCSVDSDNLIYGWDIDSISQLPLFSITRHQDLITDFIALDHLDLFLTCSLDKRIVMWSQSTRRVRGVLLGHKRGVRCMSYSKDVLLTAGYECTARTWNMNSKELLYILSGHRFPIQIAKLMCSNNSSGYDMRAVTLDQSGEFRLWNCSLRERSSTSHLAEVLQIFHLKIKDGGSDQIAKIRFIEFPYDPHHSIGVYSDIIAGSPGLIHVVPEKTIAEFIPPTTICCAEPSGFIMTACGNTLFKYDLCSGLFHSSFKLIDETEITCSCGDGYYARRIFVGFSNGRLAIVNFTTGKVIESIMVNTKGISCISLFKSSGLNLLYVGSPDGRISCIEDTSNGLNIHLTAEQVIGDNCGINKIVPIESLNLIFASSGGRYWGIWDSMTFRRIFLIEEDGIISDICLLAASGDKAEIDERMALGLLMEPGHLLTVAICCGIHVNIYTADSLHGKIAFTHRLLPQSIPDVRSLYLSALTLLRTPDTKSLNYSTLTASSKSKSLSNGNQLVASSDEGYLIIWSVHHIRKDSKDKFNELFPILLAPTQIYNNHNNHGNGNGNDNDNNSNNSNNNNESRMSNLHKLIIENKIINFGRDDNTETETIDSENPSRRQTFITFHNDNNNNNGHTTNLGHLMNHHKSSNSRRSSVFDRLQSNNNNNNGNNTSYQNDNFQNQQGNELGHQPRKFSSFFEMIQHRRTTMPQINKRREKLEQEMKLKKSQSMFHVEVNNEEIGGHDSFLTERSQVYFQGHYDVITCLLPLNDSGCILTASMDGYQRLWNMDTDCLGELPLPNLSEKLKAKSIFRDRYSTETHKWKFILERIPVNISHRDIARKLILSILKPEVDQRTNTLTERDRRRATKNALLYGGATVTDLLKLRNQTKMVHEVEDEKAKERLQLLTELCAPRPFDEDDNWRGLIPNDMTDVSVINSQYIQPSKQGINDDQTIETNPSHGLPQKTIKKSSNTNSPVNTTNSNNINSFEINHDLRKDSNNNNNNNSNNNNNDNNSSNNNDSNLNIDKNFQEKESIKKSNELVRPKTSSQRTTNSSLTKSNQSNSTPTLQRPVTAKNPSKSPTSTIFPSPLRPQSSTKYQKQIFRATSPTENSNKNTINNNNNNNNKNNNDNDRSKSPIQFNNDDISEMSPITTQIMKNNVSVITQNANTTIKTEQSTLLQNNTKSSSQGSLWKTPNNMGCIEEAFSLSSISDSKRRGMIDSEEFRILNKINRDEDRVQAFNRQVPQFLIRNTSLSTRVAVPKIEEVSHSEMMFGKQKNMYKNANASFHHVKSTKVVQQQHAIALARINQAAARIGTMVHVFTPPNVDVIDVVIPTSEQLIDPLASPTKNQNKVSLDSEKHNNTNTTNNTNTNNHNSLIDSFDEKSSTTVKVNLDMEKIEKIMNKVLDAEITSVPEWERQQHKAEANTTKRKNMKVMTDSTVIMLLEKQLISSIKRYYDKNNSTVKHITLSARILLPYYKISDVTRFLEVFQKVDTDLSGDLDIDEWCNFFTALAKNINRKQARIIFNRVDVGGKGTLSVRDLIPVVFGSCNKSVQSKIFQYIECELSKRKIYGKDLIRQNDLEKLFDHYDHDAVGFISAGYLREKIKSYQLPDSIHYTVLDTMLQDMSDEDMINCLEFMRMFQMYCMESI